MAWLSGYSFRKKITINGTADGAQTDYQMLLTLHSGAGSDSGSTVYLNSRCTDFPNDIRFTTSDGETELDHWTEDTGDPAKIWIEFDSIADGGGSPSYTEFYIYYGKSGAATASDGETTFPFFDDFPGDAIDTDKWNTSDAPTVSAGAAHLDNDDALLGKTAFGVAYCIEACAKADEQDIAFAGLWDQITTEVNQIDLHNSDATYPDDFDHFRVLYRKAGTADANNQWVDGWTDFRNVYCIYRIKRYSTSKIVFEQDSNASSAYTDTTYIPTVNLYAHFRVWDSTQESTLDVDWVFVRKLSDPEPTWGTWGGLEALVSSSVIVGTVATASRTAAITRSASVLVGALVSASRVLAITRSASVIVGIVATATKSFGTTISAAVSIGVVATASKTLGIIRTATTLIGVVATASRSIAISRASSVIVGVVATASRALAITRSSTVIVGVMASASRTLAVSRSAMVIIGIVASATRRRGVTVSATVIIGVVATAEVGKRLARRIQDFIGRVVQTFTGRDVKDFSGRDVQDFSGRDIQDDSDDYWDIKP